MGFEPITLTIHIKGCYYTIPHHKQNTRKALPTLSCGALLEIVMVGMGITLFFNGESARIKPEWGVSSFMFLTVVYQFINQKFISKIVSDMKLQTVEWFATGN